MIFEATLDFHDLGKTNPDEIAFLTDNFIKENWSQKLSPLLIITGKGTGLVKSQVLKEVKNNKLVKKFQTPTPDDGNEGAIALWLVDC